MTLRPFLISCITILAAQTLFAQNAYIKMGRQALMDGDFRTASAQLERACIVDSTNANALLMLGYSYYHSESYKKCIATYSRLITLKPAEGVAYYYRARAKGYLAKDAQAGAAEKEKYLLGAIFDFTKAIEIDPADMKNYQNRAIAYREYGVFKLQSSRYADRNRGVASLKASVADFEKMLVTDPSRSDIESLMSLSKEKLASAVGHH